MFEVGFKGWANLNRIVNTNLRELKISRPETDNAGERTTLPLQFLLHHASQLTSLTLEGIDSVDFVKLRPAPLFPLVRELFVYVVDDEFDERPLCKLLPHVPSLTALSYPANIIKSAEVWARVNPMLVQTSDMLEYPSPPCRLEDLGINLTTTSASGRRTSRRFTASSASAPPPAVDGELVLVVTMLAEIAADDLKDGSVRQAELRNLAYSIKKRYVL